MKNSIFAAGATALVIGAGAAGAYVLAGDTAEPATSEVSHRSAEVQSLADDTFRAFGGSKYQRDAGAVLANFAESGPAIQCMREHGLNDADWSLPRPVNPESRGLESSVLFNAPGVLAYTEVLMSTAPGSWPGKEEEYSGLTPEQEAIADECWANAPRATTEGASASPLVTKKLREEWWAMLGELDDSLGSETDYWLCLSEKDVDGASGIDSTMAMLRALEERTPPGPEIPDSPTSDAAAAKQWQELEAFEGALRDAEFACRADVYNAGIEEVGARIEDFREEHSALIEEAEDGWDDIVVRAEELGYTGAYESLADGK